MADINKDAGAEEEADRPRYAKFTISEPTAENALIPKDESGENGLPRVQSKSRFKVARVEFSSDPTGRDADPAKGREDAPTTAGRPRTRSRQESVCSNDGGSSPTSPNNVEHHNSHSYDTHNLKTFGHNTLETLPHLDHYRNLLSATGNIRKRPTLLELHELEKVRQFSIIFNTI